MKRSHSEGGITPGGGPPVLSLGKKQGRVQRRVLGLPFGECVIQGACDSVPSFPGGRKQKHKVKICKLILVTDLYFIFNCHSG